MQILVATGNEGKKKEILSFFDGGLPDIEFLSLKDFPEILEPEEDGPTYESNALIKARYFAENFDISAIGEDSGLVLEAFPEKFGLRTKRELSADTDAEWLAQFLELLEGVENRKAVFYSAMAFYDPATKVSKTFLGTCAGVITKTIETEIESGIPVSSVFIPDEGNGIVFSEMLSSFKNKISHRGKSAQLMKQYLS